MQTKAEAAEEGPFQRWGTNVEEQGTYDPHVNLRKETPKSPQTLPAKWICSVYSVA